MAYYPAEWNDDERIRVLMSPMPSDDVAKQSRITFWSSAIRNWCRKTNTLQFTLKVILFIELSFISDPYKSFLCLR